MAAQPIAAPVARPSRIQALDVLRGFALLGILVPNMAFFAFPSSFMYGFDALDIAREQLGLAPQNLDANILGTRITQIFFHGKMMFLFSMLFGAGVIMYDRKSQRPRSAICARCKYTLAGLQPGSLCPECGCDRILEQTSKLRDGAALWYSRMAWLCLFGLAHGFLLWYGDILFSYALAGLALLWWVRRLKTPLLITLASALFLFGTLLMTAFLGFAAFAIESGSFNYASEVTREVAAYTGSYPDVFQGRLWAILFYYLMIPIFIPVITGIMMLGIALTRTGILTGQRSAAFYARTAAICLPVGLALSAAFLYLLPALGVPQIDIFFFAAGQLVGIPTAFGYAALLILLVKTNALRFLTSPLAAVGRMALSNYLLQTILCTTFFYGYGFGNFGKYQYPALFAVVAVVWLINILFSNLWLRFFQFGPAEWLWRSLTYRRIVPITASAATVPE